MESGREPDLTPRGKARTTSREGFLSVYISLLLASGALWEGWQFQSSEFIHPDVGLPQNPSLQGCLHCWERRLIYQWNSRSGCI